MDKYTLMRSLGDGTFGSVSLAQNTQTGEFVAIKVMKRRFYTWDECTKLWEVKALQRLGHPNVIRLKEVIRMENVLYLIFESMQGSIYDLLKQSRQNQTQNSASNLTRSSLAEEMIRSIIY